MKKVAIQGFGGSYHEMASRLFFRGEELQIVECDTFKKLFKTAKKDSSVIAVCAIENTIAGSLLPNYDLIRNSGLKIVGEYKLRIKHCICTLPGQKIEELTEVHSHPIALMQCGDFLDAHKNLRVIENEDTAGAAKMIADKHMLGAAAICNALAAKMYGMEILEDGVETNKRNFTRFLILANEKQVAALTSNRKINKSSVVFAVPHEPGALSKVLSILSFYNITLTKIQSLPIIGKEWEYQFYIDLCFDDYERYRQSLDAIIPLTHDMQVLGEYEEGVQTV